MLVNEVSNHDSSSQKPNNHMENVSEVHDDDDDDQMMSTMKFT